MESNLLLQLPSNNANIYCLLLQNIREVGQVGGVKNGLQNMLSKGLNKTHKMVKNTSYAIVGGQLKIKNEKEINYGYTPPYTSFDSVKIAK